MNLSAWTSRTETPGMMAVGREVVWDVVFVRGPRYGIPGCCFENSKSNFLRVSASAIEFRPVP